MTAIHTTTEQPREDVDTRRSRWPLYGAAAGALGFVGTLVLDGRTTGSSDISLSHKLFTDLDPIVYRGSMIAGYLVVGLLLVFAAQWRRRVEARLPGSTAAHLVPLGLVASAAGLTYGYGWKGALGLYMPGGPESGSFDDRGLYVYFLLSDFGGFIGWLGVVAAAGAVAWMGLRERTVSRWIGVFSLLPVLGVVLMTGGLGVPGIPGMFGPLWLVVVGIGLAFGRSTITR
jgi:hypothetical protein